MAGDVTELLAQFAEGDGSVVNRLLPLVYTDLRALAAAYLREERAEHTLQPTALVHEAYLRMVDQRNLDVRGRTHFIAVASQAMRRILVDHARTRGRVKRGRGFRRMQIDPDMVFSTDPDAGLLEFDDALTRLTELNADAARIAEMRCFGGLSVEQAARVLGVSESTVARQWRFARAWLHCELGGEEESDDGVPRPPA